MSSFGDSFRELVETLHDSRDERRQAAAARLAWSRRFAAASRAARSARREDSRNRALWAAEFLGASRGRLTARARAMKKNMGACRQQRRIRLSELFSRTCHLRGRFQMELEEASRHRMAEARRTRRARLASVLGMRRRAQEQRRDFRAQLQGAGLALACYRAADWLIPDRPRAEAESKAAPKKKHRASGGRK